MKNKIFPIIISVILVVFLALSVVLYNNLSKENGAGGLILDMPTDTNPTEDSMQPSVESDDTVAPSTTPADSEEESSVAESTEAAEEPTNPAPDFTMVDMNGNKVKLSDLRGKPVVLNFWASWCGYCVAEMPDFEEYYKKYGDEIHFVMLNTLTNGETVSSGKETISDAGYTFPVYFDEEGLASYMYGAYSGIPRTYFIDAKGNLVAHYPAMLNSSILQEGINMIK